jgi:serine/threonine protein kinase
MEYLEGPSLREVIRERGTLSPAEVVEIIGPLCDALDIAHRAGLVHRDVKPSNVVIVKDRGPVLLDFGLVKLIDQVGPALTASRTMLGTPTAMAPEQLLGQPADARTDIYALGLLTFHMLTGQPAFLGSGAMKSYAQLHGPRPRPSSKVDLDPAIDAPVLRALAPDPADRFATAGEFVEALRAALRATRPTINVPSVPADLDIGRSVAIEPRTNIDVLVVYAEADRDTITQLREVLLGVPMTIATTERDSVICVAPKDRCDLAPLQRLLEPFAALARIAVGISSASIVNGEVDGDALDVESWAPFPLPDGLWITRM